MYSLPLGSLMYNCQCSGSKSITRLYNYDQFYQISILTLQLRSLVLTRNSLLIKHIIQQPFFTVGQWQTPVCSPVLAMTGIGGPPEFSSQIPLVWTQKVVSWYDIRSCHFVSQLVVMQIYDFDHTDPSFTHPLLSAQIVHKIAQL